MSTRKDKFTNKDRYFMNLAFNLARDRQGLTGQNPSVGCIIVKNGELLSLGQTGYNGRPHAEFNAIKKSKKSLKGSTLYSTLEPCVHYGKTPPCSNIIIKSKIEKVVFSVLDFDKRTRGKSFKIFKKNKIIIKSGLLGKKINKIYKSYKINKLKNLPFVTGKLAVSADNYIFSKNRARITNKYSDNITHLLRYKNDSILISSKTLNIDNPMLNCRINGLEKYSPTRIILDKNLNIKKKTYVYFTSKKNNTIIFYNKGHKKKIKLLKNKGIKLIKLKLNRYNLFNLDLVLNKIYMLGFRNLLVEGGKSLTSNFLKHKLFNDFYLFKSSKKLGSNGRIKVNNELRQLSFKYKNKSHISSFTGKDKVKLYS